MSHSLIVLTVLSLSLLFVHSSQGQIGGCSCCSGNRAGDKPVYFAELKDVSSESPALAAFPETVRKAIDWLNKQDLNSLPMGKTAIEGDDIFINIQEYETRSPDKTVLESHRTYVDIQLILEGEEYMGTVRLTEHTPIAEPYDAEKDVMFFPKTVMPFWETQQDFPNRFMIKKGEFVIYTPHDIHVSGVYTQEPAKLKKLVVKCKVDPSFNLASPSNEHRMQVELIQGELFYSVWWKENVVIERSRLGVHLKEGIDLTKNWIMAKSSPILQSVDEPWNPLYGEKATINNRFNSAIYSFSQADASLGINLQLTCRAYDEGIAFRYVFDSSNTQTSMTADTQGIVSNRADKVIVSEETEFALPSGSFAWVVYSAQGKYSRVPLAEVKKGVHRPLLLELPNQAIVSIGEAASIDYSRTLFRPSVRPNVLQTELGSETVLPLGHPTPWRFVMAADRPGRLVERNDLLLNLNEPCQLTNTDWIKPGKVIREVTLTTEGGKQCVDFALKMNLQYIEYDAGWYGYEYDDISDATTVTLDPKRNNKPDSLNLPEVIRYAKERGIGVFLYVNRRALEKQLDEILPLYRQWGISGIKYGFVQVGSQEWTTWLHDAIAKAAQYELMIDIHDEYRTTGNERTWPHLLTVEGIGGDETQPSPEDNCMMAILRNLCGPSDHTYCWFQKGMVRTWAHQLAAPILFYSPLTFLYWYDRPEMYPENMPELEIWKEMPTVWDETRVLNDAIGEQVTFARRSGNHWFVGAINAVKRRTVEIPLSFLEEGVSFEAKIFADGSPEGDDSHAVTISQEQVNSHSTLKLDCAANGGAAVMITPIGPIK